MKDNTTTAKKMSIKDKIKKVNEILLKGESNNISTDPFTKYTGYSPQYIIDAMNQVLFGEWGFEEISNKIIKDPQNQPTIAIASVKVWLRDCEFKPTAYGQSRITRGDYGDAKKGAQTDAIKKALSYFSIGNRAFHGLLENKEIK